MSDAEPTSVDCEEDRKRYRRGLVIGAGKENTLSVSQDLTAGLPNSPDWELWPTLIYFDDIGRLGGRVEVIGPVANPQNRRQYTLQPVYMACQRQLGQEAWRLSPRCFGSIFAHVFREVVGGRRCHGCHDVRRVGIECGGRIDQTEIIGRARFKMCARREQRPTCLDDGRIQQARTGETSLPGGWPSGCWSAQLPVPQEQQSLIASRKEPSYQQRIEKLLCEP